MVIRKKEVGIGLIGAGKIGSLRAHLAATSPVVNFFAISDIDPRARAAPWPSRTRRPFIPRTTAKS